MKLILPRGVSADQFQKVLTAFARVVGRQWVLASDDDRETYLDIYAPGDEEAHAPSAAVAPASVEEVQAVLRVANELRVPLWPISRGKNMGYGGAAPVMPGTVVLDLGRMNRILDVNERFGYCVVEPGVGFFDLHRHLAEKSIPLWMSIPGNAWGSVMGNALERGFSATPYGEHSNNICGLEVVLPNGDVVRTATGAMANSATWPLFKFGFGPSWDQTFVQSNFGVATKMGYWLMPEPAATLSMSMRLPNPEDLGWLIDVLTPLRIRRVIDQNIGITSYMGSATVSSQRAEWYEGKGALPDDVVAAIMRKTGAGWWNFGIRLYGNPEANEANRKEIEAAFRTRTDQPFQITRWLRDEAATATGAAPPGGRSSGRGGGAPAPSVLPLQVVNWHGGRGGHIGFSPILPPDGKLVLEQLQRTRARFREFGVDYSGTFYASGRHVINVNLILYDRDDTEMTGRCRQLFDALVKDAAQQGYAEYRTHLSYMNAVADSFDYNNHALWRLNQTVKDALDPNGIIAPGKSGIWPKSYRSARS